MPPKKQPSSNLLNSYHLLSCVYLDSTNEEAKRLAKNGGSHGAVIWAKRQTSGRGRLGREWVSAEGNLFVSILLQPEKTLKELSQLSFVAAVAVIESVRPLLPPGQAVKCKWPNDILVNGRKAGGILLESFKGESGSSWVAVGIGVNIDSFPPNAAFPATCLKESGVELVSAKIVLSRLIHNFIVAYNQWDIKGFGVIRKHWMQYAWGVGERITARWPDGEATGIALGIDEGGSLILEIGGGKKQHVHAADVFPAEAGKTKKKK